MADLSKLCGTDNYQRCHNKVFRINVTASEEDLFFGNFLEFFLNFFQRPLSHRTNVTVSEQDLFFGNFFEFFFKFLSTPFLSSDQCDRFGTSFIFLDFFGNNIRTTFP